MSLKRKAILKHSEPRIEILWASNISKKKLFLLYALKKYRAQVLIFFKTDCPFFSKKNFQLIPLLAYFLSFFLYLLQYFYLLSCSSAFYRLCD